MQHEFWSFAQPIDLFDRRFKGPRYIRISGFVESHVAVADLHETEFASHFPCPNFSQPAQAVRLQDSAFHHAKRACPSPCHAFQKTAPVDAIMVVIVQNLVLLVFGHSFLPMISPVLRESLCLPCTR